MPLKPGTDAKCTIDDQIKEAERELVMRKRVYWSRVEQGKMTPADMNRKIELQQAIVDTLMAVKAVHWPDAEQWLGLGR